MTMQTASLVLSFALTAYAMPLPGQATAEQHAERAVQFVHEGNLKSAESELRKAVELSPNDPALLTSLGGVLGMEGDLRQANVYLGKAVKLNPEDAASRRNLAANQWQLGRLKEAHENLDRLLRVNPQDKGATFLLGMVSEKEKDYAHCVKLLESVPDVMERQPDGWAALASAYYHTNRREDGHKALQRVLSSPANARSLFTAGQVAMDAGDFVMAEVLFNGARQGYPDPAAANFQLSLAQYRGGHAAESARTLREAAQAGHAHAEAYVLLCKILSDQKADTAALQAATEGVQAFPASYELVSSKAALEMKLQYFNAAVASYEKAAKLKPESPETKRDLATAQWRAGMREQSVSTFEAAILQFPRSAQLYQFYGTLLLEDGSPASRSKAVGLFEKAIALDDSSIEARYQLANIELDDGKPEQALPHLERAIKTDPKDSRLHYTMSRVYRRLGRSSDADREMEIYQKLKAAEQPAASSASAPGTQH
jgi:tetratricopeptide (TPR) repeat protein